MFYYFGSGGQKLVQADLIQQFDNETDRGAALVGGAMAEYWCERLLKAIMLDERKVLEFLFNPSGPLGPFRVKIDLLRSLGYLSAEAHKDLSTVKSIRNDFAHELDPLTFSRDSISARCSNLVLVDKHIGNFSEEATKEFLEAAQRNETPPRRDDGPAIRFSGADKMLSQPRQRYLLTTQLVGQFIGIAIDNFKALPDKYPLRKPVL